MRNLSEAARRAIFAQESGEVFAPLLTIDHAELDSPLRIVGDMANLTRGEQTYTAAPFSYELPSDQEGRIQSIKIKVENVSRLLVQTIRSISDAPDVTFEIVRVSDPSDVVAGPFNMRLEGVSYNALTIEGTIGRRRRLDVEFPRSDYAYVPANVPGMF